MALIGILGSASPGAFVAAPRGNVDTLDLGRDTSRAGRLPIAFEMFAALLMSQPHDAVPFHLEVLLVQLLGSLHRY